MADRTGLEPATSGVTGRHSNQLNYRSTVAKLYIEFWWVMTGSNRRPSACKADALPAELITQMLSAGIINPQLKLSMKNHKNQSDTKISANKIQ